jgi:hypothetical protein
MIRAVHDHDYVNVDVDVIVDVDVDVIGFCSFDCGCAAL